jgi:hypothetical protein
MATGQLQKVTWKWTPQRERAALAIAETKTLVEAAKHCDVSRKTLYEWLAVPEFRQRVQETVEASVTRARWRLANKAEDAANMVIDIMQFGNSRHAMRLAAAKDILDRVGLKAPEKIEHEHSGSLDISDTTQRLASKLLEAVADGDTYTVVGESDA